MNQAAYDNVAIGLMQLARDIEDSKRPGYTRGDDDVLANFKRAAAHVGISPAQAWGVFLMKHIDAILSIMTQPDLAVSEEPAQRFADAVNYLRLGYALLREREDVPEVGPIVPDMSMAGWQAAAQIAVEKYRVIPQTEGGFGFVLEDHAKMGPQ